MKKLNLWLLASLFVAAFTLTACGDDDDSVTPPPTPDGPVNSIEGTWKSPFTGITYVFSGDKFSVKDAEGLQKEGTFTITDGVITCTYSEDGKQKTESGKVATLYQKQVLVIKFKPEDGEGYSISEAAEVLYKDGVAPTTPVEDIQGNWYWYMKGDENVNRAGMMINGNKFVMIIGAWGQKYTGTFTYAKGVMKLNITNGFTSRQPHTGYGSGYGNLDPATLDGTWYVLDKEHWTMDDGMTTIFISAGTEAYSEMANLPVVYYKKDRTPTDVPSESLIGTKWYEMGNSNPEGHMYMTWVFENGKADWGNLMKDTEEGRWEKWTRHTFTMTVDGNDFTMINGEGVERSGSYVIEGDEMMIYYTDQTGMKLARIKGDLLDIWNSATEIDIFGN